MNTGYAALLLARVAPNPIDECNEQLNRRRVPAIVATVGGIVLALGACIAMPVAPLRAADDEPAAATEMKPKHEYAQSLFIKWQALARADGKIPGRLLGHVREQVENFIKQARTPRRRRSWQRCAGAWMCRATGLRRRWWRCLRGDGNLHCAGELGGFADGIQ